MAPVAVPRAAGPGTALFLWRAPLAGPTLVAVLLTVATQALALGWQLLLARGLGPAGFGVVSIAIAWLGLGLIPAKAGLDTVLLRLVASFRATGDTARLAPAVRFVRRTVMGGGVAVGLLGLAALTLGPNLAPDLWLVACLTAALLPVAAWSEVNSAALRGLDRLPMALAGDGIVRPIAAAAVLAGAWAATPSARTPAMALFAWGLGTALAAGVTAVILAARRPTASATVPSADQGQWRRQGWALMLASGSLVAMYSIDAVLLGLLATSADAGRFSLAARIAVLVLFVMNATQLAGGPRIASAVASGDTAELRRVLRQMNALAALAALPLALGTAVAAELLLALFGDGFAEAATVLRILVVAQLVNVLTGPTGVLLSMSGRERPLAVLVASGLVLQVALAVWLIPVAGIIGAAVAGLVAHAAWNIAAAWYCRRLIGVDPTVLDLISHPGDTECSSAPHQGARG